MKSKKTRVGKGIWRVLQNLGPARFLKAMRENYIHDFSFIVRTEEAIIPFDEHGRVIDVFEKEE